MTVNKDLMKNLSRAEQKVITDTLDSPLLWAETMFPAKMGIEKWQDENGKYFTDRVIVAGWSTRPWQQQVIETPGLRKVVRVNRRGGKSLMALVKCLHTAFVKGKGVLVLTPYDRQSGELYKECHTRFMDLRPEIFTRGGEYPTIIQDTKSPYVIRFANGGFINFITTGTKTGGRADAVRGQGSNVGLLFLDEMDYMGQPDLEAIFAITTQSRSMEIMCTSTPTGKREMFWELCVNTPSDWKSFHFTCWDTIPNWDDDRDRASKAILKEAGYVHEMMAEFGEETAGVFNKEALDQAKEKGDNLQEYPYLNTNGKLVSTKHPYYGYAQGLKVDPRKRRVVGVDWDKYGAGTQIVILETSLNDKSEDGLEHAMDDNFSWVKVVCRKEIVRSQFTLTNAVAALVDINSQFDPDYYYLDAGYGEHQIETLIKMGMECKDPTNPAFGIHNKIRRINFSHGIKAVDPHTKMLENRPIKPEMVGRLKDKFDFGEVILNPYDNEAFSQLENYRVEKITSSGQPKYVSVNEHIVDAMMLAMWGLYIEFGDDFNSSPLVGFVDAPIGDKYKQRVEQIDKELKRLGYMGQKTDKDTVDDDIKMAKQGFIRHDVFESGKSNIVTSQSEFYRDPTDTIFHRGGKFPKTNRRGF